MGTHETVDALLAGARDALSIDLAAPGPTRVVSLAAQDADVLLSIIERAWEAVAAGHVTGASCDRLDEAFRALALAAAGETPMCAPAAPPRPNLAVAR